MNKDIMVSIAMSTYNHGKFISQAIDSVLMQQVNFNYEIVIGDDCSPDNTQFIIKEYADKYPDIIKPILRTKNIGALDNTCNIKMNCIGKYFIILEGDDYWTDPNKLQIQVDFLEAHLEYIGVSHWCDVIDEEGEISNDFKNKDDVFNFKKEVYTLSDFKKNRVPGHTTTLMYKNIYSGSHHDYIKIFEASSLVGDRTVYMILSLKSNIYCIPKIMSHYRYINKKGGTSYSSRVEGINQSYNWFVYYSKLEWYAKEIMEKKLSLRRLKYSMFLQAIIQMMNNFSDNNKEVVKKIFLYSDEKLLMLGYCLIRVCIRIITIIKKLIIHRMVPKNKLTS